ncbi:TraR/DksA family transcriptional regulator [Desulfuromonas sp. TF]|uniref:TraR/DksA family transcriptional regulator n=1 Tax=Desulfuromonas sp. TF TaxID=1232410 RepID=UPI00041475FA|nr:TraR/DksA family transcriptional regulator [Desulfuromonas sp. TF]
MDDIDRAQGINEQLQADALEAHSRRRTVGESLTECEDCEEEIPAARRKAVPGCTRCIDCQRKFEWIQGRR